MNVRRYKLCLYAVILFIIIASTAAIYYTVNYAAKTPQTHEPTLTHEYMYFLKEYENKIGVYKASERAPFRIIDVYVYTLPSVDQYELKEGIWVQDDAKLQVIIEDYES